MLASARRTAIPQVGRRISTNIPRMGEVLPSWNGDGVFTGRASHISSNSSSMNMTLV